MALTKTDLKKIEDIVDKTVDKKITNAISGSETRILKAMSENNDYLISYMHKTFVTKKEFVELKNLVYDLADTVMEIKKFLETEFVERVEVKVGIS